MATLAERIRKNFSRIQLRRASIRVPRLRITKRTIKKQDKLVSTSSVVSILIKHAVEELKKEAKKEKKPVEDKSYKVVKEEHSPMQGGYGIMPRHYGAAPQSSYADYGKMFSYLGKFRARNAYENFEIAETNSFLEQNNRQLVDFDTMNIGTRHVRYFTPPGTDLNTLSVVPIAGMTSGEWEQFKLWTKLDPVMYRLKTSTS